MGLFSTITGFFGAASAKKASRKAEEAQLGYLNRAIDLQNQQFQQTRQDYQPYREGGLRGFDEYGNLIGTNGDEAQQTSLAALRESPLFQRMYASGEEAVLANASATGGLRGGNAQRSLYNLGEDTYARTLNDQMGRLAQMFGVGIGATDSTAQFGQQNANNVSDLFGRQGDVRAQGLLTRGGINSGLWRNAGSFLDSNANKIGKTLGLGF